MDDTTLTRRDALKLGLLGSAALTLPFAVSASAARASELPERLMPRPYVLRPVYPEPPILRPSPASGRATLTLEQAETRLQVLPRPAPPRRGCGCTGCRGPRGASPAPPSRCGGTGR